jgi:GMP synthase PP-ATPase subunit
MRCVKNALIHFKKSTKISIKKSANKIYHEKIRQKCLSAVVPQLSAVLLRVRPPSCSSQFLKQ